MYSLQIFFNIKTLESLFSNANFSMIFKHIIIYYSQAVCNTFPTHRCTLSTIARLITASRSILTILALGTGSTGVRVRNIILGIFFIISYTSKRQTAHMLHWSQPAQEPKQSTHVSDEQEIWKFCWKFSLNVRSPQK